MADRYRCRNASSGVSVPWTARTCLYVQPLVGGNVRPVRAPGTEAMLRQPPATTRPRTPSHTRDTALLQGRWCKGAARSKGGRPHRWGAPDVFLVARPQADRRRLLSQSPCPHALRQKRPAGKTGSARGRSLPGPLDLRLLY